MGWTAPSTDVRASGWAAARTPRVGVPTEAAVYPRSPPICLPTSVQPGEREEGLCSTSPALGPGRAALDWATAPPGPGAGGAAREEVLRAQRTTARAEPSAHRPERPCGLPHTHALPRLPQLGLGLRGSRQGWRHHSHLQRGLGGSEEAHAVRWELGPTPFPLQGAEGEQPGHSNPLRDDKPGRKPWRLPRGGGEPRTPQPLHGLALLLPTTPARDRASPSLTSLHA